jgi:hypothetical protein
MKKILVMMSVLIVAVACAPPSTNRQASNTSTNSSSDSPVVTGISEADAIAKEKATWEALKTKNYDAFADMLASDFAEVGSDGVYDKSRIVTYLKDLDFTDVSFANWKLIPIDNDAALLIYDVNIKGKFKGEEIPPGPYRAASAWVDRDGKWLAIYYQETRAEKSPPPSSSPGAVTSASPATGMANVAVPEDPIEREKMVWDALKRKDYDAFASFLDDGQIEITADGASDKAGTLKSVRMFDASTAELSDFKTVKLTNDAALVTYLVKIPGPQPVQERSTTIWVNRGGKWRALFHQSTPATTPAAAASPASK